MTWEASTVRRLLLTMDKKQIKAQLNEFRQRHFLSLMMSSSFFLFAIVMLWQPALVSVFCMPILLLSFAIVAYAHPKPTRLLGLVYLVVAFLVVFAAQWYNVNVSSLLGSYTFLETFLPKWLGVDLLACVYCLLLAYACSVTTNRFAPTVGYVAKVVLSSLLWLGVDILAEPVLIIYNLLAWENNVVPYQHYAMSWLIGFILIACFHALLPKTENKLGVLFYLLLFVFYWFLAIDF